MHRSGTSVITRGLQVMGVQLGDRLLPSVEGDNSKGYWEDIDLNSLNIEMLESIGSNWFHLSTIKSHEVEILLKQGYLLRAAEIIQNKLVNKPNFAFKDPRVAKLLPFWIKVFEYCQLDVHYVLACRNPLSVCKSLIKRKILEAEHAYLLWLEHVIPSLEHTAANKIIFVDYDLLMKSPDHELDRMAKQLQLEIIPIELYNFKSAFLDATLRHTSFNLNDLLSDDACPPLVQEIYSVLVDLASDHFGFEELKDKIEIWATELKKMQSTFTLIDKLVVQKINYIQILAARDGQNSSFKQAIAERDNQITSLNQALVERDNKITSLNQAIAERDNQITSLTQAIAERDNQITSLNQTLSQHEIQNTNLNLILTNFYNSRSWKFTKPIRFISTLAIKFKNFAKDF